MINMNELFAHDRIGDVPAELVPLTEAERRDALLEAGDLLFARQSLSFAGAGKCVLVLEGSRERTWESHLIRVRLDQLRAVPAFYYYYFKSRVGRLSVETIIQQVAAAGVRGSDLKALRVPMPPLPQQRAISEVLGALDDKIAANTCLATKADALAAATYVSVVDPSFSTPLSSLAEFVNGRAYTKDASGTGRVVVRIAELNSGIGGSTVFSDTEVPDQHLARSGDILFAWSGSLTLHRWFRDEAIINQHIFKVIPRTGWPAWLVWQAIAGLLDHFKGIAADKATTMGHIQRHHLDALVPVPSPEVIASRDAEMAALWCRALSAEQENLALVATRDALLPALMSGQLRVRDAERLAEGLT